MSPHVPMPPIYYADARRQVQFTPEGPQPQYILDVERAKVILTGLEPGQRIPIHAEAMALYTILEGQGSMQVGDAQFPLSPGTVVVVLAGVARGMVAETRLSFVAAQFGEANEDRDGARQT